MRKTKGADKRPSLDPMWQVFNPDRLASICEMHELQFPEAYGLDKVKVDQAAPADFFAFRDNGSSVLAVAHLDTVARHRDRRCNFLNTAGGQVVYSRALDDRLGAFIILDMLPKLGINVDVLLTVGEEQGCSTASFFDAPKEYDWIIEFDRGGTDVVMYQYEDDDTARLVREAGARVGSGTFSDIAYLDHLGVKAFNWGVGYQDYHGPRAHAYLDDTLDMVSKFVTFHEANVGTRLVHVDREIEGWGYGHSSSLYGNSWHNSWGLDDDADDVADAEMRAERKRWWEDQGLVFDSNSRSSSV